MAKLKTGPKVVLIGVAALAVVFGAREAMSRGMIPTPGVAKSVVPEKANISTDVEDSKAENVQKVALPSESRAKIQSTNIRGAIWAWNAQLGLIFANGGAQTTEGSLMAKRNVNLTLYRQDDTMKMQEELISCAKEIKDGAQSCSSGANFVIIMGDGVGQFAAAVNPQLAKLGPEYKLKAIGAVGRSDGEDSFMASPEVKTSPQSAKGILVAGVLRDGDWNIALKWAGDNNIPNNPDEKTWDPDAINWYAAPDYVKAAEAYVAETCEDRKVKKNGALTGETKKVCVNGVVTWTPGDVTVARNRGGLVRIASTKEYRSQMPSTIVGSGAFIQRNRESFENLLAAVYEAGDQIKAHDDVLRKAAAIAAKVWNEQDGNYWYRYYKGVQETDSQNNRVELGGSKVFNLADALSFFGLVPGTNDNFRATYSIFGKIATQQYPDLFKDTPIPDVKEIEDKSFITGAQARMDSMGAVAETVAYTKPAEDAPVVSKRSYAITFATNKADLTPDGMAVLEELKDSLAITSMYVEIAGHTDNVGSNAVNIPLSEARAEAVKAYLQKRAPKEFPNSRFSTISGYGSEQPVAPNTTPAGRAKNRRVEITLVGS